GKPLEYRCAIHSPDRSNTFGQADSARSSEGHSNLQPLLRFEDHTMNRLHEALPTRNEGAALLIVLAFVVLLTGVSVAYLSRTTSDRQVAHGSFNQSKADQLVASATDNIIGDLRQEILRGSASPAPSFGSGNNVYYVYTPTSTANMVPRR